MQAAHPWYRYNLATDAGILPCFTSCRRTLIQRKMRPVLVIVGDVFVHQTLQMSFVEDDHMVEQIASATPFFHGLRKLVRVGWIPKLFMVLTTSPLKLTA